MRRYPSFLATLLLTAMLLVVGCKSGSSSSSQSTDEQQRQQTEQLANEASKEVGMPDINNFQEKRFFKQILEQRDQAFGTYSYYIDMNGNPHFLCESVGYGIPASTQYTNPDKEKVVDGGEYGARNPYTVAQADPNQLFMPTSSSATYVLCTDPDDPDGFSAQYIEPEIIVTTQPMGSADQSNQLGPR